MPNSMNRNESKAHGEWEPATTSTRHIADDVNSEAARILAMSLFG